MTRSTSRSWHVPGHLSKWLAVLAGTAAAAALAATTQTAKVPSPHHPGSPVRGSSPSRNQHPAKKTSTNGLPATGPNTTSPPPALVQVTTTRPEMAFTFDDGPLPGSTPAVLRQLTAHHAHATFFLIGEEASRYPDLVRAEVAQGEDVENHGERHLNMAQMSEAGLFKVIGNGAKTIERLTGQRPVLLRPPFGSYTLMTRKVAQALGERVVLWSVDTRDWTNPGADLIFRSVERRIGPGEIVLFHDGGADRSQTVAALRRLWPILTARGLKVVTVPKLLRDAASADRGRA